MAPWKMSTPLSPHSDAGPRRSQHVGKPGFPTYIVTCFYARRSMWDRLSAVHLESCRVARNVLGASRLEVPKATWTERCTSGEA